MKAQSIVTSRKWILASAALLSVSLAGCQVDPFPTSGGITVGKPGEHPVAKPWGIEVAEVLDFSEGQSAEYLVVGHVPAPATPILAMADLPPGATFDPATGKLAWEPDFSAGNDLKDPTSQSRSYLARVLLSSSEEPQSVIEKTVTLVVRNVSRAVDITWDAPQFKMTEGEEFTAEAEIRSADYPRGPFQFFITGIPSGAVVEADSDDPTKFKVSYTPGLDLVAHDDDWVGRELSKTWKAQVLVVDPSGRKTTTALDWKVVDSRQEPVISAPSAVQHLDDVRLQVLSIDPNLEAAPEVKVTKPKFGTLDVEDEEDGFTTRTSIRWHDIPESQIGTTSQLEIRACVYSSSFQRNKCFKKYVLVKLESNPLAEPTIDRTRWPLGQMRYLREGSSLRVKLPVRNPNTGASNFTVSIEPASLRSEVQYSSGDLVITPKDKGFRQFNVNVKIPQGASRTESFSYEALPRGWSRVLVLGDGLRDPEVAGTLALLPGTQVVNPLMQDLSERTLALREAVVIGTSLLSDPAGFAAAKPALDQVPVVMVQSPRIDQAGSDFWSGLGSMGLSLQGRISAVLGANFPGLPALPVRPVAGSGLTRPARGLLLNGTLTAESVNPTLLTVSSAGCKPILGFSYAPVPSLPAYELPVAVKCEQGGRRWIVSGIEWADLAAQSPSDRTIVSDWMQEVLK